MINYLSQDPAAVVGTVRDNLLLGAANQIEDHVLVAALVRARIWDELKPKGGLDAPVYEGGRNLSGGQLRRLGIARLLARDKSIWIFDEPTASLDASNVAIVREIIADIAKHMVAVVITHDSEHKFGSQVLNLTRTGKNQLIGSVLSIRQGPKALDFVVVASFSSRIRPWSSSTPRVGQSSRCSWAQRYCSNSPARISKEGRVEPGAFKTTLHRMFALYFYLRLGRISLLQLRRVRMKRLFELFLVPEAGWGCR